MRRRDVYWSLFHKNEKRQVDDLRTDAIEVVYEVIPLKDRADWLVWREGFRNWKPLDEFPQLILSLREAGQMNAPSIPAPAPAPIQKTEVFETRVATTVQDRLARQGSLNDSVELGIVDDSDLADRDNRYVKKWELRILTGGKPVINQTVDISNRGMNLRDPVPKGLARYFNVELVVADLSIPLMCSEIKSADGTPSKRIRIEVNHQPIALQTALLQY